MERYVTQSDIGFILSYEDQFDRDASFRRGWLMQAKRLFASHYKYEHGFTPNSRFDSIDPDQHDRMKALRDWANCDFIRYLLYCPRPALLDKSTREQLSAARARTLSSKIFDYALGLELRDDILSDNPTTAAGIFVAILDELPDDLLSVHQQLFRTVSPFAWFIVTQIAQTGGLSSLNNDRNLNNPIIDGLIRGDISVIRKDETLMSVLENAEYSNIMPVHTITVKVVNGIDRPRGNHNER
jgi:hypothetical protein